MSYVRVYTRMPVGRLALGFQLQVLDSTIQEARYFLFQCTLQNLSTRLASLVIGLISCVLMC